MDINKQEYLLGILLSSTDVFSRCVSILRPEYFDGDVRLSIKFILKYFDKHGTPPDIDTVNAEVGVSVKKQNVTSDKMNYACDEIEIYCRETAVKIAMLESTNDLQDGNLGIIVERMKEAVQISLQRDLGWEVFDGLFLEKLEKALEAQKTISTGIRGIDNYIGGGLARQQVTLFTANSGMGKSIMLNNIAHNYARTGHNVVLLSLELPREMIFARTAAITSGNNIKLLRDEKLQVASTMEEVRRNTSGSLMIDRIRGDANSNDIVSYLTHYQLELEKIPDVLIVDYLDKMTPNQGIGKLNISEQDKHKAEQLAEVVYNHNLICASASQQNREAIGNMNPQQDVIAGGLTKINTVDNVISLYMSEEMRIRGEMVAKFLKTRSSDGVGKHSTLFFDTSNLRIRDPDSASNHGLFSVTSKKTTNYIDSIAEQLPGVEVVTDTELPNDKGKGSPTKTDLLSFMETIQDG